MRRKAAICLGIIAILTSAIGCAGSPVRTQWEAERNRSNMLKLQIAMTKEQVLNFMGDPYKTEAYRINARDVQFWLYLTEGKDVYDRTLRDSNFTPLAFEDGILTGWGRNYYDSVLRIKQDIKIEKQ